MKTTVNLSIIRYKGKPISIIPVEDGYTSIQHMIELSDLTDFDKNYVNMNNEDDFDTSFTKAFLGETETRWYDMALERRKLNKIFKHELIEKEIEIV